VAARLASAVVLKTLPNPWRPFGRFDLRPVPPNLRGGLPDMGGIAIWNRNGLFLFRRVSSQRNRRKAVNFQESKHYPKSHVFFLSVLFSGETTTTKFDTHSKLANL
jgi:hypothetical protein